MPAKYHTTEECPKCKAPSKYWNCFCTYGCNACGLNRECTACGNLFKVYTLEEVSKLEKDRERDRAASQAGYQASLKRHRVLLERQQKIRDRRLIGE